MSLKTTPEKKVKDTTISGGVYIQSIPEKEEWSPTSTYPLKLLTSPSKDTYLDFQAKICEAASGKRAKFLRANHVRCVIYV